MMKNLELTIKNCNLEPLEDYKLIITDGSLVLFNPRTTVNMIKCAERFFDGFAEGFSDGVAATSK